MIVPALDAAYDAWESEGAGDGPVWKSVEATSSNLRFLADHVRVARNGRHWRRVVGTLVRDPRRASRMTGRFGAANVSRMDSHFNPD